MNWIQAAIAATNRTFAHLGNRLPGFGSRLRHFARQVVQAFARLSDWLAGFGFWRFFGLSVLLFFAAAMVGDVLVGHRLADSMLAALAVLWVVWFAARSRRKAEVRAAQAEHVAEREGLERQVAEARLQALQAQIEPHFLFNTLAAVEHLIETDPPRAGTMQRHLIAFLRGAMPRLRGEATCLRDEFDLCRNYLAIMKVRMEDRLGYSIELPPELESLPFPPMMLQPIVENAIKHGIEPRAEGGGIRLNARVGNGRLRVTVADNGLGFAAAPTGGTGVGLNNIRERLRSLYGDDGALDIAPNAPTGTQVTIELPHETGNGDHR